MKIRGKIFPILASALGLAFLPTPGRAAPAGDGSMPASGQLANQELTDDQLQQGLAQLKNHLLKRGEDEQYINIFINDIQKSFADPDGNGVIPVTRQVFDTFIKYEVAWARKTRDSKNPDISSDQLQREAQKAASLKKELQTEAHKTSPAFYKAFQAAARDVRQANGGQTSAGLFTGQTDDSYSNVDAGAADLEQGDSTDAADQAAQAIAADPDNAEAYALQAAADYAQGDYTDAAQAANMALQLDPNNQQAQAVLALSSNQAPSNPGTLAAAAAVAGNLSGDAAAISPTNADNLAVVSAGPAPSAGAPTPALVTGPAPANPVSLTLPAASAPNAVQSADLTKQALVAVRLGDPLNAIGQLNQAIALNPANTQALNLRAIAEAHDHQYAAALQDVNRSLMIAPHNSATLDTKSKILNRSKDYAGALAAAREALRIDPRDAHAYFNQAHSLAGQGNRAGMIDALRQASLRDPSYGRTLQSALKQSPSADLTSLFPDRQGLQAAAERQAAARRHSSPWKKFLRRSGIQSILDEFGALSALGATGALLAILLFLVSRPKDADVPAGQPWHFS
jgi:tetratricopeptide (TPR) repeat protein